MFKKLNDRMYELTKKLNNIRLNCPDGRDLILDTKSKVRLRLSYLKKWIDETNKIINEAWDFLDENEIKIAFFRILDPTSRLKIRTLMTSITILSSENVLMRRAESILSIRGYDEDDLNGTKIVKKRVR